MLTREVSPAEEYHVASRNNKGYQFMKSQHLVHYRDDILQLKDAQYVQINGKAVPLPEARQLSNVSLHETLTNRKSGRDFDKRPLSLDDLSDVLFYSCGYRKSTPGRKHVPTSGGLNSVEAFVFIFSVDGLENGIYHYDAKSHGLVNLSIGNFSTWARENIFYQNEFADASAVVVLTSAHGKLAKKYGARAYRLSLLDVGLVSQNIYLVSTALHLRVCASAGFIDDELDEVLNLDGFNVASFLTIMIG